MVVLSACYLCQCRASSRGRGREAEQAEQGTTGEESTMKREAVVGRATGAFPELQRMLVWSKKCMFV